MSIKKKFSLIILIFVAIIVISQGMSYGQTSKFENSIDHIYHVSIKKMQIFFNINQKVQYSNTILNKLSSYATMGLKESFIKEEGEKGLKEFEEAIDSFLKVADKKSIDKVKVEAEQYKHIYKDLITKAMIGDSYTCIEAYPKTDKIIDSIITTIKNQTDIQYNETKNSYEDTINYVSSSKTLSMAISIVMLVAVLFFLITISKGIINSINSISNGLTSFFNFLDKTSSDTELISVKSKDEMGIMADVINLNITKTKELIKDDNKFLNEVQKMVDEVNKGYLTNRFENSVQSENLEKLRNSFNMMLESLNKNVGNDINKILEVLESFARLDFRVEVENDTSKIAVALNNVEKLITQMLIENKSNGLTLQNSSSILVENVNNLNINSNETAMALEETSAALEEINSTVISNSANIHKMSTFAKEVTSAADDGKKLANETTQAMDSLKEQVSSINVAISVIDQIAFQTNILSLNAAVEAATAGEAGKGFAVVAQEVRNLASRSADAAREIKNLVESATNKASDGKKIADNMISGYSLLHENIQNTLSIINDVSTASKEQQVGIEQITDAITQLDHRTQQIAKISAHTNEIAEQTNTIANAIVTSADEKEFNGKETIKTTDSTSSSNMKNNNLKAS